MGELFAMRGELLEAGFFGQHDAVESCSVALAMRFVVFDRLLAGGPRWPQQQPLLAVGAARQVAGDLIPQDRGWMSSQRAGGGGWRSLDM